MFRGVSLKAWRVPRSTKEICCPAWSHFLSYASALFRRKISPFLDRSQRVCFPWPRCRPPAAWARSALGGRSTFLALRPSPPQSEHTLNGSNATDLGYSSPFSKGSRPCTSRTAGPGSFSCYMPFLLPSLRRDGRRLKSSPFFFLLYYL